MKSPFASAVTVPSDRSMMKSAPALPLVSISTCSVAASKTILNLPGSVPAPLNFRSWPICLSRPPEIDAIALEGIGLVGDALEITDVVSGQCIVAAVVLVLENESVLAGVAEHVVLSAPAD